MLNIKLMKCSKLFKHKKVLNEILISATSTQPAVQGTQENYEKQLKDFETLTNITKKIRKKQPQRGPFAKNLFLGIFDTEVLSYPQLENEDLEPLQQSITQVEKLMKQNHMVDCNTLSNKIFRQNLSDYKLIGLQASQFMDGRECTITESNRFLEALSEHNLRDNIIYNEQLGVQTLVKFADEALKKKYLYRLMKGESLSACCISEREMPDFNSLNTSATLSNDKKTWVINGEKAWVVNGVSADILVVFALTNLILRDVIKEPRITAFLVEKDSPGISYNKIDMNGIEVANITFNDTPVPADNVIGEVDKADKILPSLLSEFRLSAGPACITLTKKNLNTLTQQILEQSNDTNILYQTDAIGEKVGEIAMSVYAMESVLYLTTGLIDTYENQDCELENTIVKVFCSENCMNASMICLDLTGVPAISESHWANKFHREAVRYLTLHETNDSLKMIIALLGLKYAGMELNETVDKLRNPMFNGLFNLKRMWTNRRNIEDNPKLNLEVGDYLHPSLLNAAKHLEYAVKRLEFATEILLVRYGAEVINRHMELRRIADCIIDIYVMTACLGRASRSYCIGLQHGGYEILIASAFCATTMERVKKNVAKIYLGQYQTNDVNYMEIAKQLFKSKGYFAKHALARNF